jgi:hypothetical protein
MNIIITDTVNTKYDPLWDNLPEHIVGLGKKPVLVIANEPAPGSAELQQQQKIIDACNLAVDKYHLIRLNDNELISWNRLREVLDPKIIFLIGVLPAQLGISALFSLNSLNNFDNRIWLPTVSTAELEMHKELKQQLWNNGMKPLLKDKSIIDF